MGTLAERQTEWARLVIDSFVRAGVREAIISPGSRSTPFVVAALDQEGLACTSAFDERSAAHYALGQARSTLVPSLLLCTSGSAPANYFPAVIEAGEAGVPLIVLSADRPPELLHCGANQTTDQVGLYGKHVRFFANLGEPSAEPAALRAVRRLVVRAVSEATGLKPGPVHLNAQARKPLEPVPASTELRARVNAVLEEPLTRVHHVRPLDPALLESIPALVVDEVAESLDRARRPIVLCGPSDVRSAMFVDAIEALCERTGALLLAEASSQFRFWSQTRALGAFDAIWRTEQGRVLGVPDFVLQLGAAPVSMGWEQLSMKRPIPRVVIHPWEWADPSSNAQAIVHADIGSFVTALSRVRFHAGRRDEEFATWFRAAEATAWRIADEILDETGDALTEGSTVRTVFEEAPDPSAVVLGNSLPIRGAETWVPPATKLLVVHTQRGVSGIDGVVSGAAGVASSIDGATTLLVGDISFLHDLNGLHLAARVTEPFVIVVVNNGGGRIFEQLPIAVREDSPWLDFFTTPHDADLGSAAATFACAHHRVANRAELRDVLRGAYATKGCTVVEAVVPPQSARDQTRELVRRLDATLTREAS
jgi:2-succinyl-5-enolpyruvyl-6-hydroxy-3-cyclohexene-1-carboxylate synthase